MIGEVTAVCVCALLALGLVCVTAFRAWLAWLAFARERAAETAEHAAMRKEWAKVREEWRDVQAADRARVRR